MITAGHWITTDAQLNRTMSTEMEERDINTKLELLYFTPWNEAKAESSLLFPWSEWWMESQTWSTMDIICNTTWKPRCYDLLQGRWPHGSWKAFLVWRLRIYVPLWYFLSLEKGSWTWNFVQVYQFWYSTYLCELRTVNRGDRDQYVKRHTINKVSLTNHLETEPNLMYSRAGTARDVWVGCLAVALRLEQ